MSPLLFRKMSAFSQDHYKVDRYKCVKFDLDKILSTNQDLLSDPSKFLLMLQETETQLKQNQLRAIWFTVELKYSSLVPILVQDGYDYHHARSNFVTLCKWIKESEPNNIPQYPFTNIGVGKSLTSFEKQG